MILDLDALEGLVALSALLWVVYGPWQWVCTDYGRQLLFEKRDALFDLGRARKIDFASVEYRTLRTSLETLIRFSHEVTLMRFLYLAWSLKLPYRNPRVENPINLAIGRISHHETRRDVNRLFREAHLIVVMMIVFKSPLLLAVLLVCSPFVMFGALGGIALGYIRRWWAAVERVAQIVGNTVQAEADLSPNAEAV